jgi:muramoyltetrapeptide carboxypeptidase
MISTYICAMITPPNLQAGDTIGICCPSGALSLEKVQPMIAQLEFWGFNVQLGKTVGTSYNKFSAKDADRLKDFQDMLDDDNIKAILFGRGGYGFVRIIDFVDFTKFKTNPKWLVGYSDITVLHNHVNRHVGVATIHAQMSGGYQGDHFDNDSIMSIYYALTGKPTEYIIPTAATTEINSCQGQLIGGNLSVISDLIGTNSDIDTNGKILVLEDIGEAPYNIDRMIWQLFKAGKFDNLAGLIIGSFTDAKKDEPDFGMTEYEIIWEKVQLFQYPICFGFPVGHQALNKALKFGVQHQLRIEQNQIVLAEVINLPS